MNPMVWIARKVFKRTLEQRGSALTIARLCTSRHLNDLQWVAIFLIVLIVLVTAPSIVAPSINAKTHPLLFDLLNLAVLRGVVATALVGATLAVFSWLYRSGNRRLGVIDLFACEISVICRVSVVTDFANLSVARVRRSLSPTDQILLELPQDAQGQDKHSTEPSNPKFTSEEHYTPIYDTQIAELIPLDVNVVTSVTQFYTYRKTLMDNLRAIASTPADQAGEKGVQMIYMQYLMYESARQSIDYLIEFEPNRAESIVNILCSELVTYGFLQSYFDDDYRGKRLRLRESEYSNVIKALCDDIQANRNDPVWARAATTSEELLKRYLEMCECTHTAPIRLPSIQDLVPTPS